MRAFEKAITKYNIMNRSSACIMVTSSTIDVFTIMMILIQKKLIMCISKILCTNKTKRRVATIFNYVKRQSIRETLCDEQKAPLFPNGIIAFVSS